MVCGRLRPTKACRRRQVGRRPAGRDRSSRTMSASILTLDTAICRWRQCGRWLGTIIGKSVGARSPTRCISRRVGRTRATCPRSKIWSRHCGRARSTTCSRPSCSANLGNIGIRRAARTGHCEMSVFSRAPSGARWRDKARILRRGSNGLAPDKDRTARGSSRPVWLRHRTIPARCGHMHGPKCRGTVLGAYNLAVFGRILEGGANEASAVGERAPR